MRAPDKIYLQVCGTCTLEGVECERCDFEGLEEVTWSTDKVFDKDVEYILKDKAMSIIRGALGPQDALNKINSL